jgi:hypothetical protein
VIELDELEAEKEVSTGICLMRGVMGVHTRMYEDIGEYSNVAAWSLCTNSNNGNIG